MSRIQVRVLGALAVVLTAGIAWPSPIELSFERAANPDRCAMKCVGAADDERRINLKQGEVLLVRLREQPSTGFAWHLEELDVAFVQPLCRAFTPDDPDLYGSPGDLSWFFQAQERGETVMHLLYYQAWAGPDSATDSLTVRLVVH